MAYPMIERISLAEGPFTTTRAWVQEAPTFVRVFDFNATSGAWTSEYVTEYGTGRFTTKHVASASLAKLLAESLESERSYRHATTKEDAPVQECAVRLVNGTTCRRSATRVLRFVGDAETRPVCERHVQTYALDADYEVLPIATPQEDAKLLHAMDPEGVYGFGRCDRCGESFRPTDERAEVVGTTSAPDSLLFDSLLIHAACVQEGTDVLA